MGVEEEVEKKFTKFVEFCKGVLGKDGEQIVILIKKRKNECSQRFLQSTDMLSLIRTTKTSMKTEPKRNMVHLKDFLNELKAYKKKRKAKDEAGDRVAKLRKLDGNCSEASTDGTVSDTESSCNKTTHELKSEDSNDSVCILDNNTINNTGDYKTDDIALPVISHKNIGTAGTASVTTTDIPTTAAKTENNSINKTDELASVQSADDDDSDVVMIADDDEDAVKVNGIGDESCVIIDDDAPTETPEDQKSLLSKLNLQRKPLINGNVDDDVIICDSIKPKQTVTNIPLTEIPELKLKPDKSSKTEEGNKSNKVKVDKASCSKSEEVKDNDGDKKKADKTDKHIKRLEALLEKLKNKIEELREQELSLEDLDDDMSSYIYEDKLERKFVTVWNKLCQIKGRNKTTGRPAERVFNYSGTRYEEMNKKLERLVNKHKEFPDFHDVKNVIKKVNNKSSLGLSASQVDSVAREAFLDVGNMLQERRHKDFMCTFKCRVQDNFSFERDPALFDVELQRKLENNRIQGKDKLEEVINKFADKQIFDDDVDEDKGREEGGEEKEKEGEETSQDEEDEEEEEEVAEDIEDVDQFVDATELLASYTPSRPAISVNPKLATFHAQVEGDSGLNADKESDSKEKGHNINKKDGMESEHAQAHQNGEVDKHKNGIEKESRERRDIGKKQNDSHNDQKSSKCPDDKADEHSGSKGQDTGEDTDVMTDSSAIEISEVEDMAADSCKDTDDDDIVIISADSEDEMVENGSLVEIRPSKSTANSIKTITDNHSAELISSTVLENVNGRSPENVSTKSKRIAPTPVSSSFMAEISNDDKAELTEGSDLVEKSSYKSDSDVCLINLENEDDVPTSEKTDKMDTDEGEKVDSKNYADISEEAGKSITSDGVLNDFIKSVGELDKSNNCNAEESILDKEEDKCLDDQEQDVKNSKEDSKDAGSSVIDITDAVEATTQSKKEKPKNDGNPKKNSESTAQLKVASPKQDMVSKVIGISDTVKDTVKSKEVSHIKDASDVIAITEPTEVATESKKVSPKKNIGSDDNDSSSPTGAKNQSKLTSPRQDDASDVIDITEPTEVATESKKVSPKKNIGSDDNDSSSPTGAKNQSKLTSPRQDDASDVIDITEPTEVATESKKVSPKKNIGSDDNNSSSPTGAKNRSKVASRKQDDASDVIDITEQTKVETTSKKVSPKKNIGSDDNNSSSPTGAKNQSKVASSKQDNASDVIDITEPTEVATKSKKVSPKKNIGSDDNNSSNPTGAKNQSKVDSPKLDKALDVIDITEPTEVSIESKKVSPKKNIGSDDNDSSSPIGAKIQSKVASSKQDKASDVIDITEPTEVSTTSKKVSPMKNVESDTIETIQSKDPDPDLMDITEDATMGNPLKDVVSNINSASVDNLESNDALNSDQNVPIGKTENKNDGTDLKSNKSNSPISGSSSSQENKFIIICDDNTPDNKTADSCSNSEVKTVESLSKKDLQEQSDTPLIDGSVGDSHEVCDISDDSQSMTSDINDNDTEITEKRDDLESNSCSVDSQSSSSRKPLLVCDFSEDSQSNDCQVIDQPDSECVLIDDDFECDSSIKLEKCAPKTLKLPEFLNTQNPLSIRNRMTNLFNKAKINVGKSSKTLNSNIVNRAKTCRPNSSSEQYSCSQVSTSCENFSMSPRKMSRHLPTTSLKKTSVHVDSFLIEIDEADMDCVSNSMEVEEDNICQSTTEEFDSNELNEVSSSICDPDVIILSDSD